MFKSKNQSNNTYKISNHNHNSSKNKLNSTISSEILLQSNLLDKRKQKILNDIIDTNVEPNLLEEILAIKNKNKKQDPRLKHKSFIITFKNSRFKSNKIQQSILPQNNIKNSLNIPTPNTISLFQLKMSTTSTTPISSNINTTTSDLSQPNMNSISTQPNDNISILPNDDDISSIMGDEPMINFDKHVDPNYIDSVMPDAAEIVKPKMEHVSGVVISDPDDQSKVNSKEQFKAKLSNPDIFNKKVKKMNNVMIVDNLKDQENKLPKHEKKLMIQNSHDGQNTAKLKNNLKNQSEQEDSSNDNVNTNDQNNQNNYDIDNNKEGQSDEVEYKTEVFSQKPKFEHDQSITLKRNKQNYKTLINDEQNNQDNSIVDQSSIIEKKKRFKMNKNDMNELKLTKIDKLVKNIVTQGDNETKNTLIQLLIDKLKSNPINSNNQNQLNLSNQNNIKQTLQKPQNYANVNVNLNSVPDGNLNSVKNFLENQSSPYKMLQSIDPYQNNQSKNNYSTNPLSQVYGQQQNQPQQNNINNNDISNPNSASKDEANSFFDPLSVYNEISNPKSSTNTPNPSTNTPNTPLKAPSPTNLNSGGQLGFDTYKSQGPLGVKQGQLKMNNLELLKSAFSGLKGIGIDVKDVARSAMTELKKKPDFDPSVLKDINNPDAAT